MVKLDVPYRSQWDPDGGVYTSDCGPTCVGMILRFYGREATINQLAAEAGMSEVRRLTSPDDLARAAALHGVALVHKMSASLQDIEAELVAGRPVIALIHYGSLGSLRQDSYNGGHWLVVIGMDENDVIVNDPDWAYGRRAGGAGLRIPRNVFEQAMLDCKLDGNMPNQAVFVNL